jgi:alkylhydroperoxidase/carboxymuconolactone decarboxylase family protein YurZ
MDQAAQLDPAYAAARAEVRRLSVGEDSILAVKMREFVVIGVLASRGLQYGVEAHMRRAIGSRTCCLRIMFRDCSHAA